MTKRILPAHVYERRRKSGTYLYFERAGRSVRLHERPGTPAFQMELARVMAEERQAPTGRTFKVLIASYRESARYKERAPRTRADYDRVLRYIEDRMGRLPADKMLRKDVLRAQQVNADSVRFANYIVQVLVVLFEHAIDLNWRATGDNPARGVQMLKSKKAPRTHWPDEKVAAFREAAPLGSRPRLVFELCLGTGQRIGDVLKMRWSDIEGDGITVRQSKTGAGLWLPITGDLRAALDVAPRRESKVKLREDGRNLGETIVQRQDGGPASYRVIADEIMAVRRQIGAETLDIHGLRHTTARELAGLGLSDEMIASVTGHATARMVAHYAKEIRQRKRATQAMEAREQATAKARTSEQPSEQEE